MKLRVSRQTLLLTSKKDFFLQIKDVFSLLSKGHSLLINSPGAAVHLKLIFYEYLVYNYAKQTNNF